MAGKNPKLKESLAKVRKLLRQFTAWNIQHVRREDNHEAHELAQEVIDQDPVVAKIEEPLFRGREYLSKIVDYLLTGCLPGELKKGQK